MTGKGVVKVKLKDGTVTIDRYVLFDQDRHGKARVYFRKPGCKKIRLLSEPGTQAFLEEYRVALAASLPAIPRASAGSGRAPGAPPLATVEPSSLRWLFNEYMRRSRAWRAFGKTTKSRRVTVFNQICDEPVAEDEPTPFGTLPFKAMRARQMRVVCNRAQTMATYNARVKAFRCAFSWAVDDDLIDADPSRDLKYWREDSEGFHTWTEAEVRQYWAKHPAGSMGRLAIDLLLFSGQRRSDVVTFGRQHVKAGEITFTQFKGRKIKLKRITLPILAPLQASIDATAKALGSPGLTFLHTSYGKPFTSNGFGNWFRKRCNEAGLPHCSAHGLRKAGATIAAENGATTHQLMAIFGWETIKQAELYTRAADQKKMARTGMRALVIPMESDSPNPVEIPENCPTLKRS